MTDPIRPDPCNSAYVLPLDPSWAQTEQAEEASAGLVDHIGEAALESPTAIGTMTELGGVIAGHLPLAFEAVPMGAALYEFGYGMYHVAGQAGRGVADGLLREAFTGASAGTRYAHLAAIGGLDSREVAALARQLPPDQRAEMARRTHDLALRTAHPSFRQGLRVAREAYGGIVRDFNAGATATMLGRADAPHTRAREAGRAWADHVRRSDPAAFERMQALALGSRDDGVVATAHGRVDERRYERDAAYRVGVDEARELDAASLRARSREIEGQRRGPVRGSSLCPAMG